ncbi:zinc knuckle protein (macronuclear) [Tetrahymena thermophila SB210]|uniref:Zinc knuckle protein n=1 Tax=Tetrahymena thermophila (strain SB210) TaxID=312017 RepID=W7X3J0_TETTS|nr:zinc knuckle protein [Tetrahymena thermophila SB210]EWS73860.1 zinc knuckle protein [Tetrahymena thermophila SB210]|eukprot:XP_012653607.1 zinc knuckle protein [Tetrahymena thermophila SB210]
MQQEKDLPQKDTREFDYSQNNSCNFFKLSKQKKYNAYQIKYINEVNCSQFDEAIDFNQQKSIRDGDNNRKRWVSLQNDNIVKRISEESVKQIDIQEMSDTQSNILRNSNAKKNFEFKQISQELSQSKDSSALAKFFKNSNDQDSILRSRKQRMSIASQDGVNSALMSLYEDKKIKNTQMSKAFKAFKQSEIYKFDNQSKLQQYQGSQFQKARQIWVNIFQTKQSSIKVD